jgi:crotonobetainyl-CoA:carnitine CoA-transferase CaiB-like acyl-CoA transferase
MTDIMNNICYHSIQHHLSAQPPRKLKKGFKSIRASKEYLTIHKGKQCYQIDLQANKGKWGRRALKKTLKTFHVIIEGLKEKMIETPR